MANNIKVVPRSLTYAYTQRQGDFAPSLVGRQLTEGASLFTFGNFNVTTNLQSRVIQEFTLGGQWSEYYNLDNLNLTETESEVLASNDISIKLNFNPNVIDRYVYFGSFAEFVRTNIESIITKWKGSLFLDGEIGQFTILSNKYNSGTNTSFFTVPVASISNPYSLKIELNQEFSNLPASEIYNLSRDYNKYVIYNDLGSFKVIGYTGSTKDTPYLYVIAEGNPFPSLTASTFGSLTYHIKPNNTEVELFFTELEDFESLLLNRLTVPSYTSQFSVPQDYDGTITNTNQKFTWPTTDGYNLDNNTFIYTLYVEGLLKMAQQYDEFKTDLVARRFVSESIHQYDTTGGYDGLEAFTYGQKINKLLRIYGREFDYVKKYIDGISFANVVTYNKLDNTSDELIKVIAKNLGFDVLLTMGTDNFDLLQQIETTFETPFSGYSRSLSSKELDIELWRRLVINAWWLFKSKGTRKVLEFFLNLFKIPQCMISLDEYVYLAENKLNQEEVYEKVIEIFNLNVQLPVGTQPLINASNVAENQNSSPANIFETYPIDAFGFPDVKKIEEPFQSNGFWYNGGNKTTEGNNPHYGVYDFGRSYFDRLRCFIPNFEIYLTASTLQVTYENYFTNYNNGTFNFDQNGLPVPYYSPSYGNVLNATTENAVVTSAGLTNVGTPDGPSYARPSGDTYSMKISFKAGESDTCNPLRELCAQYNFVFGQDGIVYYKDVDTSGMNILTPLDEEKCCKNYWLPNNTTVVNCPNPTNIYTDDNGIIYYYTNQKDSFLLPEECCSSNTLGISVYWNPIKSLCFETDILVGGGRGETTGFIAGRTIEPNYSASELFNISNSNKLGDGITRGDIGIGTTTTSGYFCYWCPPKDYIQIICNADDYLAALDPQQIINFATSLGWVNDGTITATEYLYKIYDPFFIQYGCLILDGLDSMVQDRTCCTLLGGTLIEVNGVKYCTIKNNACPGSQVPQGSHLWITSDQNLVTETCCTGNGQFWTTPITTNTNISLTLNDGTVTSFLDTIGATQASSFTLTSTLPLTYCSSCPTKLLQQFEYSTFSGNLSGVYIMEQTNSGRIDLTQNCCLDYGFVWDNKLLRCSQCPNIVNYGTTEDSNLIVDPNGNDLLEQCCTLYSGWYGISPYLDPNNPGQFLDPTGLSPKCYLCAPPFIYDSNGTAIPNPDYTTGNNNEILYIGQSLSYACCQYYGGNWDQQNKKCNT